METVKYDLSLLCQTLKKGTMCTISTVQKHHYETGGGSHSRQISEGSLKYLFTKDPGMEKIAGKNEQMATMFAGCAAKSLSGFLSLKRIIAKEKDLVPIAEARSKSPMLEKFMERSQLEYKPIAEVFDTLETFPFICQGEVLKTRRMAIQESITRPIHYLQWPTSKKIAFLDEILIPFIKDACKEYVKKCKH